MLERHAGQARLGVTRMTHEESERLTMLDIPDRTLGIEAGHIVEDAFQTANHFYGELLAGTASADQPCPRNPYTADTLRSTLWSIGARIAHQWALAAVRQEFELSDRNPTPRYPPIERRPREDGLLCPVDEPPEPEQWAKSVMGIIKTSETGRIWLVKPSVYVERSDRGGLAIRHAQLPANAAFEVDSEATYHSLLGAAFVYNMGAWAGIRAAVDGVDLSQAPPPETEFMMGRAVRTTRSATPDGPNP